MALRNHDATNTMSMVEKAKNDNVTMVDGLLRKQTAELVE
ncbi:uncharacterized protein G2W53_040468 [Senna tora]|uniref:Uncharacterized protein n=1 Tax=Senna tora TaxID=362788 RepID=A0A834SDJ7_9FABA|nr:uncharacterized protein G2W53_040468 [Senna tora]